MAKDLIRLNHCDELHNNSKLFINFMYSIPVDKR